MATIWEFIKSGTQPQGVNLPRWGQASAPLSLEIEIAAFPFTSSTAPLPDEFYKLWLKHLGTTEPAESMRAA